MKNTQKDINWITAVLDHDISELKETLEAVQALRVDEEQAVTRSDLATAKREAQAELMEQVKNLAEYAYKVCVRRNETYASESAKAPSSDDAEWVPFTLNILCESGEVRQGIYDRRDNTFTLEDFTFLIESDSSWKLYRAVFKNQLHDDKFTRVMGEPFYGWVMLPANEPMAWRRDGVSGMIEGAPCTISTISLMEIGGDTSLSASVMLPFRPE
jgi:hypothetical protein